MSGEKFEIECFFKLTETTLAPFLLKIDRDRLTISARINENEKPDAGSLGVINELDDFLHRVVLRNHLKDVVRPEKISLIFG